MENSTVSMRTVDENRNNNGTVSMVSLKEEGAENQRKVDAKWDVASS